MARRKDSGASKASSQKTYKSPGAADSRTAEKAHTPEPSAHEPYGHILDAFGKGYFEVDLEGTLTFANRALIRVLGLPEQDLLGRNLYDIFPKETASEVRRTLDRVLLTGTSAHDVLCPALQPEGSGRQLEFSAILSCDEEDKPSGFRGLVRDVTDREISQAMTRATLDSQSTQLCILDELGVVRGVNRAWDATAGTAASSAGFDVGSNYLDALDQSRQVGISDAANELEGVRAVLEGRRREFSFEYKKPSETKTRWYLLTATPLVVGGRLSGAVLSRLDTTQRRLAEEELTTLYKAMDSSIEGLALLSPEGASLFMNPAFAHLHGYDAPVELAGTHWGDLYPADELDRLESTVLPQLRRLGYWSGEMRGLLRGGGTYDEEVSFTLIEKGQVIISSVRDVSERKRSDRALRESEQNFRAIFHGVMEGILVVDPTDLRLLAANRALLKMFGYPEDIDLSSIDLLGHFPHAVEDQVIEHLAHAISPLEHRRIRLRAQRSDGTLLSIEAIGTRMDFEGREAALIAVDDVTARVESQAALFKSEALLRAVIESAQDIIFVKDLDQRYVTVNPAMAQTFGRSVQEMEGLGVEDILDAEGAAVSNQSDRLVLSGRSVEEEVINTVGGKKRAFHAVKVPLRDASGQVLGICGIARDVTDRMLAEEELKKKDALLASMAEATRELLVTQNFSEAMGRALALLGFAVEADQVFLYQIHPHDATGEPVLSQRFEWTSGQTAAQIDCSDYQNIPMTHPLARLWKPALDTGGVVRQIVRDQPQDYQAIFSRNGVKSLMVLPVHCGGDFWGCVGFSDCTNEREWSRNEESILTAFAAAVGGALQRKRDEERLRLSEERLRFLVENMSGTFYYIQNPDGTYAYISPSVETVTGYTPEFIMAPRESLSTDNPINLEAQKITDRVLKEGFTPPPYQYEMRHRDGRPIMLEAYERPILKDGKVVCALGLLHDITDRLAMQAKLEHYRRSQVIKHISMGLAHEVRNPLLAINVTMEALQKKLEGQLEVEPYLKIVQDQTRRLADLIRDMLDLGRPSDPSHRQLRQLEALAGEASDVLEENGPGSSGRLVIVPPPAPILVRVEGSRIVEAFANIIENALALAPPETQVRVTFEILGERVVARIHDEGPGVPPEMLPLLFQPFVTNRPGGTGLGLAVVERIVRDHGGEVWVENHAPGPGCTFSFSLPLGDGD